MIWVLKKVGWSIALVASLLGIFAVPQDALDLTHAISVWDRVFTVGNREIALTILCVVCLSRLAYLDIKRALNDADWPPVRRKLLAGLAAIFKADARLAALREVADDSVVMAYRTRYWAEFLLNALDFSPIEPPMKPYDPTIQLPYGGVDGIATQANLTKIFNNFARATKAVSDRAAAIKAASGGHIDVGTAYKQWMDVHSGYKPPPNPLTGRLSASEEEWEYICLQVEAMNSVVRTLREELVKLSQSKTLPSLNEESPILSPPDAGPKVWRG